MARNKEEEQGLPMAPQLKKKLKDSMTACGPPADFTSVLILILAVFKFTDASCLSPSTLPPQCAGAWEPHLAASSGLCGCVSVRYQPRCPQLNPSHWG